jgi:hypothetical protein
VVRPSASGSEADFPRDRANASQHRVNAFIKREVRRLEQEFGKEEGRPA